jgi:hypothetical protein
MKSRAAFGLEPPKQQSTPPSELLQGPQAQDIALPSQLTNIYLTKGSIKALPKGEDNITDQLGPDGDEHIPREYDEAGEKKVTLAGHLLNGRNYRCQTFFFFTK